jgi:hypothetical protein
MRTPELTLDTCGRSTPMPTTIAKGSRISASWFSANPIGTVSIAGVQAKTAASLVSVTGTVVHIRADDPVNPVTMVVFVDADPGAWEGPTVRPFGCTCVHGHVAVNADRIVAVDDPLIIR